MNNLIYIYVDPNKNKVTLTKKELEALLEKAFNQGYYSRPYYYSYAYPYTYPYYSTTTSTGDCVTISNTSRDVGLKQDFATYTSSLSDSIIFTTSQAEAEYGIGTNMND